jgi:putative acetyltransferase
MTMEIKIQVTDPALPEARSLIEKLDAYLKSRYPAESNYLLSIKELQQPNVTFLTAGDGNRLVGCGALVNHHGAYGEIKRMFVSPDCRGHRIGQLILEKLEEFAHQADLEHIKLETGIYQPEAIKLYERCGYHRCQPHGDYNPNDPLSVFMEKILS